ncbi:MAG TPA: hypothetical protein VF157_11690, partial [Chloroflexota bacterium]
MGTLRSTLRVTIVVAGLSLVACGQSPPTAQSPSIPPVRMGTNSQVPNATYVWLTSEAGVFARNGVPVELRGMTGQAQTNAMVAGDLDAEVHAGVALVLSAAANGTPLKIVADMQRT